MRADTARLIGEFIAALYSPAQVRAPKGDPEGGRWVAEGAGGQMALDFDTPTPKPGAKITGWHTSVPGGFSIGMPGQRGPGTYISLDKPWQPGSGQVLRAEVIDIASAEILDPRALMIGTDVEKSRRDQKTAIDRINAMTEEELRARGGKGIESLHKAIQSLYEEMGYKAEAGLIEPGMPEYGRELVVWRREHVRLTPDPDFHRRNA